MEFLFKKFIKNHNNTKDPQVVKKYGLFASIIGIVFNIILFAVKFLVAILSGSVSIISDAFNNLGDASSSIVTLIGFKMSSKPADREHPFGHQRVEYICAFIISFMIIFIGVELAISSVERIVNPTQFTFNYLIFIILIFTIFIKLWMSLFYNKVGRKINSLSLKASSKDAFNDVITTFVIIVGLLAGIVFNVSIDGYLGLLVSGYILVSGVFIVRETIDKLIGGTPDKTLIDKVCSEILKEEQVLGIHDVLCHVYGLGNVYMSLHVEMDSSLSLLKSHSVIDLLERKINKVYGVDLVIHVDPILLNDELLINVGNMLKKIIKSISDKLNYHELKIVNKKERVNICFDLQVPYEFELDNKEIYDRINKELKNFDSNYRASITFEKY